MGFLRWLFTAKKNTSKDVLGRYPEYMQVRALPERRYIKTSRLLAVAILINIGITLALGGIYIYLASRVDVSIATRKVVNLFYIDTEQKRLRPAEHTQKGVYAMQLMGESYLRDYIDQRNAIVWDNNTMLNRWGENGIVYGYSHPKFVYPYFQAEINRNSADSRNNGFVRDVHLYELELLNQNLWQGIFDVFDMPIPDAFNPLCPCTDNSPKCIACKEEHALKRRRYKAFIRTNFDGIKTVANPLGFVVYSYNVVPMAIHPGISFWDTPRALKPEL